MKSKLVFILILTSLLFALISCKSSDEQISAWVEKNPDKILQTLMQHQRKQQEAMQPSSADVKANATLLFANSASPSTGSGPIKIAYFFDFNCGHCAKQGETIKAVLAKKSNVQVIYKNFAVLGPSSELAARAALAAHQQGKYLEFYNEAFKIREKNPKTLKAIAKKIKLNLTQWEADMEGEVVRKEIEHVNDLAAKMKLTGTPALAIAPDQILPGRIDNLEKYLTH